MILDPNQPFVDKAQRLSSWGHWFTFFNILFAIVLSASYIVTDSLPNTVIGMVYLLFSWLGHTAFITFIVFVLTIFPLSLVFPYPRHIRGMAAIIATSGMILLAIDAYSYSRLGYHISSSSLEQVVTLLTKTWENHPFRSFTWVFGISGAILAFELYISNFTWKRLERLKEKSFGKPLAVLFLTAFISSHLIHIWGDATFEYDVTKQNNMFPFSYPATARTLLAKNGLLDKKQFQQARSDQLALRQNLEYNHTHQAMQCNIPAIAHNLEIVILAETVDDKLSNQLVKQGLIRFDKHYVPTAFEDAIFDLVYGLPSIYKDSIVANRQLPQWYLTARDNNLSIRFVLEDAPALAPYAYIASQSNGTTADISITFKQLTANQLLNNLNSNSDAIQIIVSKAQGVETAVAKAPMFVRWPGFERYKRQVTQNLGISTTIIESWMRCTTPEGQLPESFGKNILEKSPKQLAANYTAGTIVSIKKDRIILLDDQGNDLQISASTGYKLNQPIDIPTLNDTIKKLKTYTAKQ